MQSNLKTTLSSCKVLANSSNSPLPAIPDQSTNHIADSTEPVEVLAYRHAICLVISQRIYFICFNIQFDISDNAIGENVCSIVSYSLGDPVSHS